MNFTHLAGGQNESIACQIGFISKHVWQFLEVFTGHLSQTQQVIVYRHAGNSLGASEQNRGIIQRGQNYRYTQTMLALSHLISQWLNWAKQNNSRVSFPGFR